MTLDRDFKLVLKQAKNIGGNATESASYGWRLLVKPFYMGESHSGNCSGLCQVSIKVLSSVKAIHYRLSIDEAQEK